MRLFTAIDLSPEVRENLVQLLARLRPTARLNWSSPQNLHVTTKFIGEWPEERLSELTAVLQTLCSRQSFAIEIRGLGWFPNPHHPRVLWAGVSAPPDLAELARATEGALTRLGIARESRPFSPHLTLARIKGPADMAGLRQAIAGLPNTDFGSFTAHSFVLYLSELGPRGSVYTKLVDFPFEAAA